MDQQCCWQRFPRTAGPIFSTNAQETCQAYRRRSCGAYCGQARYAGGGDCKEHRATQGKLAHACNPGTPHFTAFACAGRVGIQSNLLANERCPKRVCLDSRADAIYQLPMPQPFSARSWTPHPAAVLQRPKHAALIGAIAAEWTQVELALTRLLAGAFGKTLFDAAGEPQDVQHHPVALAAMKAAESIRARLRIFELSLTPMLSGTTLQQRWEELQTALKRRARERNKIVHGHWGISDEAPNDLLLLDDGHYYRFTAEDLEGTLTRCLETKLSVIDLTRDVMKAVHQGEIMQSPLGPITGQKEWD